MSTFSEMENSFEEKKLVKRIFGWNFCHFLSLCNEEETYLKISRLLFLWSNGWLCAYFRFVESLEKYFNFAFTTKGKKAEISLQLIINNNDNDNDTVLLMIYAFRFRRSVYRMPNDTAAK